MDRAKHELLREGVGAATYAMCYVLCNAAVIKKKQIEYHGSGMIGGVYYRLEVYPVKPGRDGHPFSGTMIEIRLVVYSGNRRFSGR